MNRLDGFLAYTESHRGVVYAVAAALTFVIAWIDWLLFDVSIGFLYLIPILFSAPAMSSWQIAGFAALCGFFTGLSTQRRTPPGKPAGNCCAK